MRIIRSNSMLYALLNLMIHTYLATRRDPTLWIVTVKMMCLTFWAWLDDDGATFED